MLKLYAFLIAAFLLSPLPITAQTEFAKFEIPAKTFSQVLPTVNPANEVHLLGFTETEVHSLAIDSQGKLMSYSSYPKNSTLLYNTLGSVGLNDKFLYFQQEQYNIGTIYPYKTERGSGDITALQPVVLPLDENSKFVQAYTSDSRFYTIYFSKKTQMLQLFEFSDGTAFVEKKFHLTDADMYDRLLKGEQPVFIDTKIEQNISTANSQKKIFQEQDKIYFVFDSFGSFRDHVKTLTTEVLELNLSTGKSNFTSLPPALKIRGADMNSYLYKGTLYRLIITTDYGVKISATDVATNSLIKEYLFMANEPLAIKSTPVLKNTPQNPSKADKAIVENTKDVLKKMNIGVATIIASDAPDNTLHLAIGSYKYIHRNSTLAAANGGFTAGRLLASAGPAALPAALILGAARMQAGNGPQEEISYFHAFLEKDSLTSTSGNIQASYTSLIANFENSLADQRISFGAAFAYPYNNQLHYGYLDKKTKQLRIVAIAKE